MLRTAITLFIAIMLGVFSACTKDDKVPVSIVGYNHTDKYIHSFTVNGSGGSNAFAHSGGGSFVCCVLVPKKWHAGLQAKIRWMNEDDTWNEAAVDIPSYSPQLGDFQVHFMKNGSVKAFVFDGDDRVPGYPLQGKESKL